MTTTPDNELLIPILVVALVCLGLLAYVYWNTLQSEMTWMKDDIERLRVDRERERVRQEEQRNRDRDWIRQREEHHRNLYQDRNNDLRKELREMHAELLKQKQEISSLRRLYAGEQSKNAA